MCVNPFESGEMLCNDKVPGAINRQIVPALILVLCFNTLV